MLITCIYCQQMTAVVTIGFVKDAKHHIDVQGFNVYHKNRLIKVCFALIYHWFFFLFKNLSDNVTLNALWCICIYLFIIIVVFIYFWCLTHFLCSSFCVLVYFPEWMDRLRIWSAKSSDHAPFLILLMNYGRASLFELCVDWLVSHGKS